MSATISDFFFVFWKNYFFILIFGLA